jgi:tetratricopeptide (TPR) repeat protein
LKKFYLLLIGLLLAGLLVGCGNEAEIKNTTPVPAGLEVVTAGPAPTDTPPTVTTAAATTTVAATTLANTTAATTTLVATTAAPTTAAATTAPATTTAAPTAKPAQIKSGVLLEPMSWERQTWNNCAPMSIIFALSYYGVTLTQEQCGKALRPNQGANDASNTGDKHVTGEEVADYIRIKGFKTLMIENGSLDTLRALLSAGIPVITQQWLKEGDEIGHYRTARGYDLSSNVIIFNDSMADGPKTVVSSALQDRLWKGYDRRYFPVYTAKQEATVLAILGEDANPSTNRSRALAAAEKYADNNPNDIDSWRNLGYLYYASGDCKSALNVWEQHLTKMLVPNDKGPYNHFLWYQLWPIQCYNKVGNYQQVIKLAPNEIEKARIYAEARYEYAVALSNTGRKKDAIDQLKLSILDDQYYQPARSLLDKLQAS